MKIYISTLLALTLLLSCKHKLPEGPDEEAKRLVNEQATPNINYDIKVLEGYVSKAKVQRQYVDTLRIKYREYLHYITFAEINSSEFLEAVAKQKELIVREWKEFFANSVFEERWEYEQAKNK